MTWFERFKSCETPEEMAALLDDGMFCAEHDPMHCDGMEDAAAGCVPCIAGWLGKEAAACEKNG